MSVKVSIGRSSDCHFLVSSSLNVKTAFGPHAFLVDKETNKLVDLDDSGAPSSPLREDGNGYWLWSALVAPDTPKPKLHAHSRQQANADQTQQKKQAKKDDEDAVEEGSSVLDEAVEPPAATSEEAKAISDTWKMAALEAKVGELTCWIEALTAARKAQRQPNGGEGGGRRRGKKGGGAATVESEEAPSKREEAHAKSHAPLPSAEEAPRQQAQASEGARGGAEEGAQGSGGGKGRGGVKGRGGPVPTPGYGFAGKQARPKDLAAASVLGTQPTPVSMPSDVEGGGVEWEGQPVVGFRPIGYLDSCFLEKNGTPRQGSVAKTSRGTVDVNFGTNPEHALSGLKEFSHVWVLWLFHDNGNKTLKAYIHPPRLNGERRGIFATRTPHRPNPIGLSLCRLDNVEGSVVHLSGVDIIQGTPILDIKPYIPYCDHEDASRVRVPEWILSPPIPPLKVEFSAGAQQQLEQEVTQAITDVLQGDPRSVHLRKKGDLSSTADKRFVFALDAVDVTAAFDESVVTVEEVVPVYSKLKAELLQAQTDQAAAPPSST